jgi:hypothetical protein
MLVLSRLTLSLDTSISKVRWRDWRYKLGTFFLPHSLAEHKYNDFFFSCCAESNPSVQKEKGCRVRGEPSHGWCSFITAWNVAASIHRITCESCHLVKSWNFVTWGGSNDKSFSNPKLTPENRESPISQAQICHRMCEWLKGKMLRVLWLSCRESE